MNTIPLRLDWLWFLGYDLDSEIPNHSVLSKARGRWGVEAFRSFFERIVWQCVEAGLVDGTKLFVDSSLIEADASNHSVVSRPAFEPYLVKGCRELEARLDEPQEASLRPRAAEGAEVRAVNRRHHSTTDPDASVVARAKGSVSLKYKLHRAVDGRCGVITATEVTRARVNEAHRLLPLVDQHHGNTARSAETLVADTKYGTVENYLACDDRGSRPTSPTSSEARKTRADARGSSRRRPSNIIPRRTFICARRGRPFGPGVTIGRSRPSIISAIGASATPVHSEHSARRPRPGARSNAITVKTT
ncbi:MAG: transposase [Syntrophaceae bacterium]|nr:transposase [Syntrophaceae bacterium]